MSTEKRTVYILIIFLAVIWGSSFILMKYALNVYTPYQVGAFRILIAFLFLFPVVIKYFRTIKRKDWKFLAATGFLGNGIPSILFPLAETKISSALAGMINSLTPVFTLIVGMLLFGMRAGRFRIGGLTLGLAGAVIMIAAETGDLGLNETNTYALYVVLAAICYAFSVNILRFKLSEMEPLKITAFALFCAGIPFGIVLFSGDFVHRTMTVPGSGMGLLYIALLGIFSTAISTVLFNKLIKISGALSASSVTYLIPVVAVMWGIWDNETLGLIHLIGLVAILGGVYLINKKIRPVK